MNKNRWTNPAVSLPVLALKLTEEASEVGGEISDAEMRYGRSPAHFYKHALTEIEHVEFLCGVLRDRLTKEIESAIVE
jgi:hypothetical protein